MAIQTVNAPFHCVLAHRLGNVKWMWGLTVRAESSDVPLQPCGFSRRPVNTALSNSKASRTQAMGTSGDQNAIWAR